MNIRTHIRRARASTVIASLALFVALGGSATAASLMTGANIKDGTLTGKDVKNSTLTGGKVKDGSLSSSDLSKSAQGALKGATGDRGSAGQAGPPGTPGAQGPRGIVTPQATSLGGKAIADGNDATSVLSKVVPAGSYVITAKVNLGTTDGDTTVCSLFNGNQSIDQSQWQAPTAADLTAPMTLTAVANVTTGPLSIECSKDGPTDGNAANVKLIAIPVS